VVRAGRVDGDALSLSSDRRSYTEANLTVRGHVQVTVAEVAVGPRCRVSAVQVVAPETDQCSTARGGGVEPRLDRELMRPFLAEGRGGTRGRATDLVEAGRTVRIALNGAGLIPRDAAGERQVV